MFPSLRPIGMSFALLVCSLGSPALAEEPNAGAPPLLEAGLSSAAGAASGGVESWWEEFGPGGPGGVIAAVLAGNTDLAAAGARVRGAHSVRLQSAAPLLPSASFDVGMNLNPSGGGELNYPPEMLALFDQLADLQDQFASDEPVDDSDKPDTLWSGNAQFNFGLQFDMGRSVATLRAAEFEEAAARGDEAEMKRLLSHQAALCWLDLRSSDLRVTLLEEQLDGQEALLEITRARYEGGNAGAADVLQQIQQVASSQALLPQARQGLRLMEVRLEALAGQPVPVETGADLPRLPPPPFSSEKPEDVVLDRPDLRASKHRLAAAKSRRVASGLAFLPTIRLQGSVGKRFRYYEEWGEEDNWTVGASLQVPLFDGLLRAGQVGQAQAAHRNAELLHTSAIRAARAEVQSAGVREEEGGARVRSLETMVQAAAEARALAEKQYREGIGSYLSALSSLLSHQAAQLTLLQAQRDLLAARFDLYTALGAALAEHLTSTGESR